MNSTVTRLSQAGLDSIETILGELRAGRMVVMMDDADRENEGDLIMAAEKVRPEDVNFMARYGRGLICLTLTRERCAQLRLPLMVNDTDHKRTTNFTVSIEAAEGVTTGISAYDRAHTIRTGVKPDARPQDLKQPGHIFPLMAQPGGVLTRAGHTEAGCDLMRLAGLEPAAAIVEILNEDGSMARRPDLEKFAHQHKLKIGTIADLIRYRLAKEKTVERIAERSVPTEFGEFRLLAYEDRINHTVHLTLLRGEIKSEQATLVRVHLQNTLSDVVGVHWEELGWPLRNAMIRIAREGGVLVILRQAEDPATLVQRLRGHAANAAEDSGPAANVLRTYGIGAQILLDLGVRRMRVLSQPKKMHGLSGFGLEVVEYVNCD
ncbi:MAG: 3,4-dihydroxy-2-butanone-4-phosphate synthase [Gammaproteobacteria bacterium]|nr:3,4-dihydroxy-2-butanone-4-phosphate synthase [Gammaproteobacteria bacterium]MDE2022650.1 3,4-dihydroxy-2-butanone-4-phosphate synthase [Gammaproteobacteria bacterium]MDE2138944.1 3,4-dihydroxy-2-butanone-4-phosphate synthase [Gammaproteobacteria bacterium]MDE2273226.1 3,4-dihydroxy-2-butanone-4-phosphate synthase [Gammaproteobacteria bacterium]